MLCFGVPAWAQSDTTPPAITLNDTNGSPIFSSLPSPLVGTVYDEGGIYSSLAVRLYRNHSGSFERWTGGEWVNFHSGPDAWWSAPTTPTGEAGTHRWSVEVPWPTGANLRDGTYTIAVTAWDHVHNRSDIHRTVRIGAPDTTAPALTIVTPANGHLIDSSSETLDSIAGTVNDGAGVGVAYVEVSIGRTWYERAQVWDGNSWDGYRIFRATLGVPDAAGERSWSLTDGLPPREQLGTGHYLIDVLAYDYNGNRAFARHSLHAAPRDTVAPMVSVTFPAQDQQLTALPELRGTSSDAGSGVARVEVALMRWSQQPDGSTGYFNWDGERWGTTLQALPSRLDTSWRRTQNLPKGADLVPGRYMVICHAIDRYGNITAIYPQFSIVPAPPLSIDAHLRGDDTGAWLGEGFSNADAQGQTLTGTIAGGQTQTRQIRLVRSGGLESKTVRVTIPDWQAFADAGWTASFTNAQSAIDITSQLTSDDGWSTAMEDGDEKIIRAEITAPANVTRGATGELTFRAEADPTSETSALDVVKATWTATVATPDLSIRAAAGDWQGEGIFNETGEGQTAQHIIMPTETVRQQIKLTVADSDTAQMVRWSVPNWDEFAADGWTARFFDAPTEGNNITDQIIGGNHLSQVSDHQQVVISVEVTAPIDARDVTRELKLRVELDSGASDTVKADLQVLPNLRPDVYVNHLKEGRISDPPVGRDEYSPTPQSLELVAPVNSTQKFAVMVANSTQTATQFLFSPPELPEGWSYELYDALEEGNVIETEGEEDILTPLLAPNEVVFWRLEVTAGSSDDELDLTIPLRFSGGNQSDQCDIEMQIQGIEGAEYTLDAGATWTKATDDEIIVPQGSTLGMKALKLNPNVPWPTDPFEPVWEHEGERFYGELTFLYHPNPTPDTGEGSEGETVRVECGNNFTTKVRVKNTVEAEEN